MLSPLSLVSRARRPKPSRRPARPRFEALEARLVLSWSSVPPPAVNPPSTAVAVTLNSQGDASGDATIAANEVDYYNFIAPVGGSYRIAATTPASGMNPVLGVYSGGSRVAYNDDISASNPDSQVTVTLVGGARYSVGITNLSGGVGGSYTWQIDGPADDAYEENDFFSQAKSLGTLSSPRTVSGLVMADAADWFSFKTTAAGTAANSVSISFQNAQGNLDLQLYNSAGQVIRAANTAGNVETVSLDGLAAGTYSVRAFGAQGARNPSYSLTVTPPSATPTPTPTPTPTGAFDIVIQASGMTASEQLIFDRAAARWEQVIVGDVPDATYNGVAVDDLLIDAQAVPIDGVGGILGQAGPDSVRSGTALPIHGTMRFDTADLSAMEANGTLYTVILHEMGHVLGIGTIWRTRGLLSGAGTANPLFLGARATAESNAIFATNAAGVPVEGTPAPAGTRDGHWRDSLFGNELMTGYLSGGPNPLSRITVASLADLGYTVNMAAADAYTPPASALAAVAAPGTTSTTGPGASLIAAEPSKLAPPSRRPPFARPSAAWLRGVAEGLTRATA